jgi:hypothetical protein
MANQHRKCWTLYHPRSIHPHLHDRTTTFRRPLGRRRRMVECPVPLCELVRKTGRTARAFSIPTLRPNALFQWRHSIARMRTLLEVRQTLGHGEAPADGVCRIGNTRRQTRAMVAEASSQLLRSMSAKRRTGDERFAIWDGSSRKMTMIFRRVFASARQDAMGCRLQGPEARVSKKSFARLYLGDREHGPAVRK